MAREADGADSDGTSEGRDVGPGGDGTSGGRDDSTRDDDSTEKNGDVSTELAFEDAREDLLVALVVAFCTVALTITVQVSPLRDPGVFVRMSPVGVYLLYLLTRKGGPYSSFDTTRNWILVTVAVTAGALAYVALG